MINDDRILPFNETVRQPSNSHIDTLPPNQLLVREIFGERVISEMLHEACQRTHVIVGDHAPERRHDHA